MLTGIKRAYDVKHSALVEVDGEKDKVVVVSSLGLGEMLSGELRLIFSDPPLPPSPPPPNSHPQLCKEAELDATKYIDSHTKKIVKVDHVGQTATTVTDKPLPPNAFDGSVEEKRVTALAGLDEYLKNHFSEGRAACGAFSKGGKVTLVISGDKVGGGVGAGRVSLRSFFMFLLFTPFPSSPTLFTPR